MKIIPFVPRSLPVGCKTTTWQIEGNVAYTINREQIEIRSAPLEITYDDSESHFRIRGDDGEVQVVGDSGDTTMNFRGNAIVELAGWRVVADEFEIREDMTGVLRGNIQFRRLDGQGAVIQRSGEIHLNGDSESLEEIIANAIKE